MNRPELADAGVGREERSRVKCLVWDLDETLWHGVLLEGGGRELRPGAVALIEELDRRGVLQSIASKNDADLAWRRLQELKLQQYFLHPQIHWGPKSESMRTIARELNIGLDTLALLDDQPFERDEVRFALPEVLCLDSGDLEPLFTHAALNPKFVTEESRLRRQMYIGDAARKNAEQSFTGTPEEFLSSLQMRFRVHRAVEQDLRRAEELTLRTNQLNTTGYTYSYDELVRLQHSDEHTVLVASLDDRYGSYGKIGLGLIERHAGIWKIRLLLMSCRVMSRGVGTIMLRHIMAMARRSGVRLQAEFVANDRNRMMYVTYKFEGFREIKSAPPWSLLEADLTRAPSFPGYVELDLEAFGQ